MNTFGLSNTYQIFRLGLKVIQIDTFFDNIGLNLTWDISICAWGGRNHLKFLETNKLEVIRAFFEERQGGNIMLEETFLIYFTWILPKWRFVSILHVSCVQAVQKIIFAFSTMNKNVLFINDRNNWLPCKPVSLRSLMKLEHKFIL